MDSVASCHQTAQDALGGEHERMAILVEFERSRTWSATRARLRARVQARWYQAIMRCDWALEEVLFDHLWPGVFTQVTLPLD